MAQPGHPVPELRYLDALVSSRQHHPDDFLKPPARNRELLIDLVLQHRPGLATEVGFDDGKSAVQVVVPRSEDFAVVILGRGKPRFVTCAACLAPGRPVQSPHPVQPPVEEQADLLKGLQGLLAFLVAALHIVLVRPGPALEEVAEQSAQHAGQDKPGHQEKQLLSHSAPSRRLRIHGYSKRRPRDALHLPP